MVPRCELCNSECFGNLQEAPQTERKGTPKRSESARRTGLRILGLIQKIGMVNVHLVVLNILAHFGRALFFQNKRVGSIPANVSAKVCTASGKKIHLLFCNMNTYGGRKPR